MPVSLSRSCAFQFTHPVWGATWGSRIVQITIIVSIHAPRVGCDSRYIAKSLIFRTFQFTHPVWGATPARVVVVLYSLFQFTHPVWGATDHVLGELGSRKFQFTHPVWGATPAPIIDGITLKGFNSRTPCGVRPVTVFIIARDIAVSIHAPRVGCDSRQPVQTHMHPSFNSRTPCGVRLRHLQASDRRDRFNSRTPCGVRPLDNYYRYDPRRFNSRTPCGVRRPRRSASAYSSLFQFTHPVWGAT